MRWQLARCVCFAVVGLLSATSLDAQSTSTHPDESPGSALPGSLDPHSDKTILKDVDDGEPLQEADLGLIRGGQTIVVGNQTLTAVSSGNAISGGYTAGDISLNDNALSAFGGLGNFAINTGAQVSLQSGMNVTINIGR